MKEEKESEKEDVSEENTAAVSESSASEKSKSRDLYWIIGVMVGLVILFFVTSFIFQSFRTFTYGGLTFTKEKFGEIPLYKYSYNSIITPRATETKPVTVFLRNDPRENNVSMDGEIALQYGKTIYITVNSTGITQCPYSTLSVASLSSFLASNGFTLRGATVNEVEAQENNITYVTCEAFPYNPVILIQSGEITRITKENNCYTMEVSDCEILPAVEKFIVQSIVDSRDDE